MSDTLQDLEQRLSNAVQHFWAVREQQATKQGGEEKEAKDRGSRGAVTGGKQLDGFIALIYELLVDSGLSGATIYCSARPDKGKKKKANGPLPTQTQLPGWFRAEKDWDLLVVVDKELIAAIEFKSQVGPSFGNNFNNRTEEALGNAIDILAAYEHGAFKPSQAPWIGYMMLLEDAPGSTKPVNVVEPHFNVFPEFKQASYAKRYEILLEKLVRERLYDAACFLMSSKPEGLQGKYTEPNTEIGFRNFIASLMGRAIAVSKTHPPEGEFVKPEIIREEHEEQD